MAQDSPCSGKEFGILSGVSLAPDAVRFVPARAVETRRVVNAIPIGMIMACKIFGGEFDTKRLKHREIRALVRGKGIEQRAVPIKQHGLRGKNGTLHAKMLAEKTCGHPARIPSISWDLAQTKNPEKPKEFAQRIDTNLAP